MSSPDGGPHRHPRTAVRLYIKASWSMRRFSFQMRGGGGSREDIRCHTAPFIVYFVIPYILWELFSSDRDGCAVEHRVCRLASSH